MVRKEYDKEIQEINKWELPVTTTDHHHQQQQHHHHQQKINLRLCSLSARSSWKSQEEVVQGGTLGPYETEEQEEKVIGGEHIYLRKKTWQSQVLPALQFGFIMAPIISLHEEDTETLQQL